MEVAEDIDCENKSQQQKRTRRVGLLYDERMCKHSTPDGDPHPENPNRIKAIWNKLQSAAIPQRCVVLEAKEAEDKHILSVHTKKHVDLIRNISSKQFNSRRNRIASKFNSIYLNEGSSEAAYLAAGSAIEVAERVAKGELDSAMAIIRPPGHHAEQDEAMGFCLYNNVAIAASVLLNEKPELGINKILIVDWDVHHGNGTQKMFWKDPRVLFFSVHRHEFGSFYPANGDGFYTMIGEGPGAGYNINVPWENGRCGDADYFAVWDHILVPVAKEFNPDLIIVSAGFDAAAGDPLGGCRVTPYGYAVMLKKLMSFANGKIVLALEGGYNLESIASSTLSCVEVLLDDNPIHGSSEAYPFESTWRVIQAVRRKLSAFWPSLADKLPETLTNQTTPPASENESEVPSLVRCPRSTELPTTSPQSAVEAAGHVNPPAAEVGSGHEATPLVEPEAKAEMLVHPQNQNLIPPQEVTSTFYIVTSSSDSEAEDNEDPKIISTHLEDVLQDVIEPFSKLKVDGSIEDHVASNSCTWRSELSKVDIWYASFGSNLCLERFLCYIKGGQMEGMKTPFPGCADKTPPKEIVWKTFPRRLFFGRESTHTWGPGGVAFLNPESNIQDKAYMCLYRITLEQFNDVLVQENVVSFPVNSPLFDLTGLDSVTREEPHSLQVHLKECWYSNVVYLGKEHDIPILTMTCTKSEMDGYKSGELPLCAPAKNYVNTIARGLVEGKQLSQEAAMAYLTEASVKPLG
ncbi:histone deacetylase 5-like isoform X1 [Malus sylvestris]|uniref:histone deacetylase 5-like isoform X1 n=1 Tax=Malus sylvestris TaxID=3752 RepID=UPI0021ACE3D7|nr:histone deacetylase 5-like isoform X1 [Malus sylvestris]